MNYPLVYDYSQGPPSPNGIKAHAGIGVVRYLPKQGNSVVKVLTPLEYSNLTNANIPIALVGEQASATRALGGYNAGASDAEWFASQARILGVDYSNIYAAYDFNSVVQSDIQACVDYARGWHDVLEQSAGAYGFLPILSAIHNAGLANRYWLCGSQPQTFPDWINLYQWNNGKAIIDGIDCDINYVLKDDWGQNNMALTDADAQLVAKHVLYDPMWSGKNPDGSTWLMSPSQVLDKLDRELQGASAKVDALATAVAKLATSPDVTADEIKSWLNDAVAQHLVITGTVQIGSQAITPAPGS